MFFQRKNKKKKDEEEEKKCGVSIVLQKNKPFRKKKKMETHETQIGYTQS